MIGPRSLYIVAALFGAAGVALRLAPLAPPALTGTAMAAAPAPAQVVPTPAAPRAYDSIITSNVFSSTRSAPAARLVPEGLRRDTGKAVEKRAKPAEPPMRLYGITRSAEGAVVLIDADPAIPGAEVYRVGDQVRGARITAITDSTVVLGRPSGPLVLRLPATQRDRR